MKQRLFYFLPTLLSTFHYNPSPAMNKRRKNVGLFTLNDPHIESIHFGNWGTCPYEKESV